MFRKRTIIKCVVTTNVKKNVFAYVILYYSGSNEPVLKISWGYAIFFFTVYTI